MTTPYTPVCNTKHVLQQITVEQRGTRNMLGNENRQAQSRQLPSDKQMRHIIRSRLTLRRWFNMKKPYLLCLLVTKPDDTYVTVLNLSKILYIILCISILCISILCIVYYILYYA